MMYWQDLPAGRRYLPAFVGVVVTLGSWTLQLAGWDDKFLVTSLGLGLARTSTWPMVLHEGNSAYTGPLAWLLRLQAQCWD